MKPLTNRAEEENKMLRRILADVGVGWCKADYKRKIFIFSDYLKQLLGLDTDRLGYAEFLYMIRSDYRVRMGKELENYTNQHRYDQSFPVVSQHGEIWLRLKSVYRETDSDGSMVAVGFIQQVPEPDASPADGALMQRTNNLLYQLNSISQTLLSFLKPDSNAGIVNRILSDILKQFKGGRAYIIEYDLETRTQTCTYEVVDPNVTEEQDRIDHLPMSQSPWWTAQILSGQSIVLSSLDELPGEAADEREFLALQQIRSIIVVPLASRNGVWGYVGIDIVEEAHEWSNEDCLWFTSLANIINICMELQKSEREALADKTSMQNLYRYMPVGYVRMKVIFDRDRNPVDLLYMDANPAAEKFAGGRLAGRRSSEVDAVTGIHYIDQLPHVLNSEHYIESTAYSERQGRYYRRIMYSAAKDEVICLFSDMTELLSAHEALDRSEKILRNIYDNLTVGIELYDRNGVLVDMNHMDMEIFGVRQKEDVMGVRLFENPNIPDEIKESIRNEEPVAFRLYYPFRKVEGYYSSSKDGYVEIYTKVSMLYDTQGNLINYLFINIDNTEINQAYSRIAEFESSFSLVSKFGKVGYCKFDLLTREGDGVPQWYYNLGEEPSTPLSEIIGVYNHIHDEDRLYLFECIRRVKAGEIDSFSADLRVDIADAEHGKWTRVNVTRNTMNSDPHKFEMICVNYDITELKETEKNLIEAKNKAEVSDRLKSAFLANMSHEIRTPLNAIVGFSNLLVETADIGERRDYIGIVQENNELLLKLISDILDLSKIEAGTFEFVDGDVDVNQLCGEVIRSLGMKASEGVEIVLGDHLPECNLVGDKSRLTQILTNFVNNALKFTPQGTITLGYGLTEDRHVRFYVRDTGCGIPAEKQATVFDRFVKLNSFVQGTGLGLSICKSLVEQMGGRIGVESKEGEGTCFWFTLPFVPCEKKSPDADIGRCVPLPVSSSAKDSPVILVAEDTDSNYLLINLMLKREYTVLRAVDGAEAVELFRSVRPDLILMDMKMPVMDGIEATREIRKIDPSVPIIATTAFAFDRDRQRALEAGCTDYLSKPVQAVALKEKLHSLLRR